MTGDRPRITDQMPSAQRMSSVLKPCFFRKWIVLSIHDAPAILAFMGILIRVEF